MKILMVCLGNICRSPLAEGIMRHKVREAGLDWHVDSAGTTGWHSGELPDQRSIFTANKNGIDITDQRARQFSRKDFEEFDRIFVMDRQNYANVLELAGTDEHRAKVQLLLGALGDERREEVPDPYYDGGFDMVFEMINEACDHHIAELTGNMQD